MFEKYQNESRSPQPPLQRGAKFLKVPLFKGDLGGSAGVRSHTKKFSNNLLDKNEREKSIKFHYLSFSDLIKFNFILLFFLFLANQYFYLNKFS